MKINFQTRVLFFKLSLEILRADCVALKTTKHRKECIFPVGKMVIIMETRVALIGIVVENTDSAEQLNQVLHQYGKYIIGRMGIPYQKRNVSIISVAVDAPANVISALSGKLGMLDGVSTKTIYSKLTENGNEPNN